MIEYTLGGRCCKAFPADEPCTLLIQPVDDHDEEMLEEELALIRAAAAGREILFIAFRIRDWNRELSPWEAPPVFGKEGFGDGAAETLRFVTDVLIPDAISRFDLRGQRSVPCPETRQRTVPCPVILGGYSLAGFFALWSAYQTGLFAGIAAASPSVWFPGWISYAETHEIKAGCVYLSLGDKEEKTRNRVMAAVGDAIRRQHAIFEGDGRVRTVLEWNPGNHFRDPGKRSARAFAWCLEQVLS